MARTTVTSGDLIDHLASQSSRRAMVSFLRTHRELWDPAIVEDLYEQVVRLTRADLRHAEQLADAAIWLADKLADDGCRAQGLRAMGHVLLIRGKYNEALEHYDEALELFRDLGRELDVGRTLSGGALQSLMSLGRYDEAFASAQEAREIFERHGDRLRLARLDSNLGNILHRQDRFPEALALYERARAELMRVGQPQDVAAVLMNMLVCCTSLNEFHEAVRIYAEARQYYEAHDMPLLVVQADYNIAYVHYLRGEYSRALELYRATEERSERIGDPLHRAVCDLDRSEIYLELNLSDEAAELAARALARFEELGMAYEAGKSVTNLAIAASHAGDTERALELFPHARELFTEEGNQVWLAQVDFYQALVLYRDGRYLQAQRLCQSALELFASAGIQGKVALCELLVARLELDAGDPRAADHACSAALKKAAKVQSPILSYQAHFVLGLIREAQHQQHAAYAAFEKARASLEHLRSHLQAEDLKIAFLKDKLAVYESLVSLCLASGVDHTRRESAFGYIEEAKSRSLADLIAFRASSLAPRVDSDLGDEVSSLRQQINWHYRQIEREEVRRDKRSTRRVETLRQRARTLEKQLVTSLNALRTTDEEFISLQSGTAFRLDQIREVLAHGTILLEYYQARGQIYACVLGRERLDVVPVASATVVRKLLRLLQFQLSKVGVGASRSGAGDERRGATEAHLAELYTILVAPIRDRLQADHLVIVPHGLLHFLPFHALYDGARFLIDAFTVSYAPSASVYRLCCMKPREREGDALVMGVPDARAPYIAEEVQAVAQTFPGARVFLGPEATAERLRTYGPPSPFIHIATHGSFRRENPMFSSIQLGSGPLSVIDLYQLRLSAELVTLSGCGTGLNAIVGGDELLGLVRGLLYAGARTVLVTLWDAHDMSTAEFMGSFYRHLQSGSPKARAMQLAMQDLRSRSPHPFYWAPFILVGQANQD
jgi:CHAT domain-containing protein/predicted negative regulator of RcsB-dependent stress response